MDFLAGYKTISGIVGLILTTFLVNFVTEGEVTEFLAVLGQVLTGMLTIYGLIMKVVRRYKEKQNVTE